MPPVPVASPEQEGRAGENYKSSCKKEGKQMKLYQVIYWTRKKVGAYAIRFIHAKTEAEAIRKADVKPNNIMLVKAV